MPIHLPGVIVDDDGVVVGRFSELDFDTGLAVTVVGGRAIIDASGGGGSLEVQNENSVLSAAATILDFQGAGVHATVSGTDVTVTIPGWDVGLLAARPAAAAANEGMGYYATDVDLAYVSDGATWTTLVFDHGTALTGLSDDDHPQYMQKANNLSDVSSVPTSKTNLKVGYATRTYSQATFR